MTLSVHVKKALKLANPEATKARLSEGRQLIGIKNLEIPDCVQPRKVFDKQWASDLAGWFKDGSQFPPARVYQLPDGRLIQAEGHHRRFALQSIGEDDMLCDVVNGTMDDAIVYAAGSNRLNRGILQMGDKDIAKAVQMLFGIKAWWHKSNKAIGEKVGCHANKVIGLRARYAAENSVPLPKIVDSAGRSRSTKCRSSFDRDVYIVRRESGSYRARYKNGDYSAKTEKELREKLAKVFAEEDVRSRSLRPASLKMKMTMSGFELFGWNGSFPGCGGWHGFGIVVTSCEFREKGSLVEAVGTIKLLMAAVGRIVANSQQNRSATRSVILCYREDGPPKAIELFEECGIEFMKPHEFFASLGPVIPEELKTEANGDQDRQ